MRIERYKTQGKSYYRAVNDSGFKVHLGTAESIVSKIRPDIRIPGEEKKKGLVSPRNVPTGEETKHTE